MKLGLRCGYHRLARLLLICLAVVSCVSVMFMMPSTYRPVGDHGQDLDRTLFSQIHSMGQSVRQVDLNHTAEQRRPGAAADVAAPKKVILNGSVFDLIVPVSGQLGNRMFQYASLLGIAHRNGRKPFYAKSSKLDLFFKTTHIADWSHKNLKVLFEKDFASYDPSFETLPQESLMILQYFQSWKYFDSIQETIRKEFSFKESTRNVAAKLMRKYSQKVGNKTTVGVHVRRGDYMLKSSMRKGYHSAPASYLHKAMDYMREKYDDVIFIVITTDVGWCVSQLNKSKSDYVVVDKASAEVHLAMLTSCDHVIMTVGTFGWWGGYLSRGDVVYYWDQKEMLHTPPLPVELRKHEDFFPPSWIPFTG